MDYVKVEFERTPAGPMSIILEKYTTITKEGFGTFPYIWPTTIVQARYGGIYEGGLGAAGWLAFPVLPHVLSKDEWRDWAGSDIECMEWWRRAADEEWPIGRGNSPDAAWNSLLEQVATKAGLELDNLVELPTWDRDELRARNNEIDLRDYAPVVERILHYPPKVGTQVRILSGVRGENRKP